MIYSNLCQSIDPNHRPVRHWSRLVHALKHGVRWGAIALLLIGCWLLQTFPSNADVGLPSPAADEMRPTDDTLPRLDLDASNISSEKVSQFVKAYLKVMNLIEQREGELSGAETDSESIRVQQDIEAEALAAIEQTGLTWSEYIQLLGLANSDPDFGERIAGQLEEALGN